MQWLTEEPGWLLPEEQELITAPSPEELMQLGAGLAQAAPKCLIGCAPQDYARAAAMMLCGAVASAGGEAVLVPDCVCNALGAASEQAGCGIAAFCGKEGIRLFARSLLPLTEAQERWIQQGQQQRLSGSEYGKITVNSALSLHYPERLRALLPDPLPLQVRISAADPELSALFSSLLRHSANRTLHNRRPALTLQISGDGRRASVYSEKYGWFFYEQLLMMLAFAHLRAGEDAALPYWLPQTAEQIAAQFGRNILRYSAMPNGADTEARALAAAQGFTLEAGVLCADLLRIHATEEPDLRRWADKLPQSHTVRRVLRGDPAAALRTSAQMHTMHTPEGLLAKDSRGSVLLRPSRSGRTLTLLAEAASMELAQELAAEFSGENTG